MRTTALNESEMKLLAPSVFAERPAGHTSEKYSFVSTVKVLDILKGEGWFPVAAQETRSRAPKRKGFQKHILHLRHPDYSKDREFKNVGDVVPEIVITNSHDSLSCFSLRAGLFRLACSNGLIVSDQSFNSLLIRHLGFDDSRILAVTQNFVSKFPEIAGRVDSMRSRILREEERLNFAIHSAEVKWQKAPIDPIALLSPRRYDDHGKDLWTTYNVVQENLMRGGILGKTETNRTISTRPIRAIDAIVYINTHLWELAAQIADYSAS